MKHPSKPAYLRLYNFIRRPWADKWLVFQVYMLLGFTRLAINTLPFHRLEKLLGPRMVESATQVPRSHLLQAREIAWAIRSVSPYTPWESNCFPQALTAKILLRRRGIATTLYMGAAFKQESESESKSELEGHAWLRCGPMFVTGGNGGKHFGAVAAFGA